PCVCAGRPHPHVKAIHSCGFTSIILQQPTEPFATSQGAAILRDMIGGGHQDRIAFPLVGAFLMKMSAVLCQGILERALPKQDQARECFLFDRSYPTFCIGIQIVRLWREWHARDACLVNNALKGWAILAVSVMDKILA